MDCHLLLTAIFGCLLVTVKATVDLSCEVQRAISQPVTGQPQCPDSNTHLCPNDTLMCSCFGEGGAIEWQNAFFSNNLDFSNTGSTMVGARETDANTGATAVVTAVNPLVNITANLTLNVTTTAAVNAMEFNNTAIRCQDGDRPPGRMEQTILIYAPPPAPTITDVSFTAGVSFAVKWSETSGSCETVDGFAFNITPDYLSCTRSTMTTVTCSYNRTHLGQMYTFSVAALNCGTQSGDEATITINLQVPNPPTLTATPLYDSTGSLLEIESQATEGPPLNITDGVDSSLTEYIFFYGTESPFPVSTDSATQCTYSSCQHIFNDTSSQAQQYTVSVAARNVVGVGNASTPVIIDSTNRAFNVTIDTASQPPVAIFHFLNGPVTSATCAIQYGTDPTYMNLPNNDSSIGTNVNSMTVPLSTPLQADTLYYCLVSSVGVQMQGTFRSDCVPEDLGTTVDTMLNDSCQSQQSPPSVGSVQIGNGTACYNGLHTGSEAVYSCNCGFRLQGAEIRRCQSDGLWSETTPVCQTDCSQIPPPPSSLVPGGQLTRNACTVLEYDCPPVTFTAMSGILRYKCSNQQWSAADVTSCSVTGAGLTVGMTVGIVLIGIITILILSVVAIILCCIGYKKEASKVALVMLFVTVFGIPCALALHIAKKRKKNIKHKKGSSVVVTDSGGNDAPDCGAADPDKVSTGFIIVLLVLTVVGIPCALALWCIKNKPKPCRQK